MNNYIVFHLHAASDMVLFSAKSYKKLLGKHLVSEQFMILSKRMWSIICKRLLAARSIIYIFIKQENNYSLLPVIK